MARQRKAELMDIRRVLLQTENAKETAAILGISDSSVVRANKTYGWITLRNGCRYRGVRPEASKPRWICYCVGEGGVVNVEPQCSKCGTVPTWAKAG